MSEAPRLPRSDEAPSVAVIRVHRTALATGLSGFASTLLRGFVRFLVWFFAGALDVGLSPRPGRMAGARALQAAPLVRVLLVLGALVIWRWGLANPAVAGGLIAATFGGAAILFLWRAHARARLLAIAAGPLATAPLDARAVRAPFLLDARPLQELGLAVDRARRGDLAGAAQVAREIDAARLEPDEQRMREAVLALAAAAAGDKRHAQLSALAAFPTGAEPLDGPLAHMLVEGALHDGARLTALVEAFERACVRVQDDSTLGQELRFALVKLNKLAASALPPAERDAGLQRARARGDLELERRLADALREAPRYR